MELTPRRRRAISTALALLLATESVSAVAAAARVATVSGGPAHSSSGASASTDGLLRRPFPRVIAVASPSSAAAPPQATELRAEPDAGAAPATGESARSVDAVAPAHHARQGSSAAPSARPARSSGATAHGPRYRGRNHVWIPALGIDRSVAWFPCDRKRPPGNFIYRWGCAGANNVYLLGHAYSAFNRLHDAYVSGRLSRGMRAIYADGGGRVHTYAVRWWRVVRPTTAASWAWAAQRVPSMTLQTCVGRDSQYRLMVRLVEVSG